ncbi:MAG: alkaline phosphatase family protein, partial [Bacteroidota bacterium]
PIYEFTSSGLTHTWGSAGEEINQHRVGNLIISKSFGIIKIDWEKNPLEIKFEAYNPQNELLEALSIIY